MQAKKCWTGSWLIVLAAQTCSLALAQDRAQPAEASVFGADQNQQSAFPRGAEGDAVNWQPADNRYLLAWNTMAATNDLMSPEPEEQLFPAPSMANSQEAGAIGGCCPDRGNSGPTVYGEVEAVIMQWDSHFNRQPIIVDAITGDSFLSTSDLDSDFDPGLRVTLGIRFCGGQALEFSYFGLFQNSTSATAVRPGGDAFLTFPDNLFGNVFVGLDRARANYSSSLNSFELNFLPCSCGCCDQCCDACECGDVRYQLDWFAGFRYIEVDDHLRILVERDVNGGIETGSYDIRTENHLYGLQLGARLRHWRGRFGWESTGKVGVFGNDANERQSVTDFPDFALRPTVSSSGSGVAVVGEANLSGLYRLTNVWNIKAGYSVMWIGGLALAPDQLDFNFASSPSGDQLDRGGSVLLHGVNVGLEARW
jgi:Putative beta barrel porin-7 (BBP7)